MKDIKPGIRFSEQRFIVVSLVALIKEFEVLEKSGENDARKNEIYEQVRAIGYTADFFGGWDAMKKLCSAATNFAGQDPTVGYWLNRLWDRIGDWMA